MVAAPLCVRVLRPAPMSQFAAPCAPVARVHKGSAMLDARAHPSPLSVLLGNGSCVCRVTGLQVAMDTNLWGLIRVLEAALPLLAPDGGFCGLHLSSCGWQPLVVLVRHSTCDHAFIRFAWPMLDCLARPLPPPPHAAFILTTSSVNSIVLIPGSLGYTASKVRRAPSQLWVHHVASCGASILHALHGRRGKDLAYPTVLTSAVPPLVPSLQRGVNALSEEWMVRRGQAAQRARAMHSMAAATSPVLHHHPAPLCTCCD